MTLDRIVRGGKAAYRHSVVATLKTVGVPSLRATLPSGIHMNIGTNDILARRVLNEPSFERAVRSAITGVLREGMNVVDIGANIGYYSILAARMIGPAFRVLAIEPQPGVVGKLRENIALNGLTNVDVVQAALSNAEGPIEFLVPESGMESHGSLRANSTFAAKEKVTVPGRLLDRRAGRARLRPCRPDQDGCRGRGVAHHRRREGVAIVAQPAVHCFRIGGDQ